MPDAECELICHHSIDGVVMDMGLIFLGQFHIIRGVVDIAQQLCILGDTGIIGEKICVDDGVVATGAAEIAFE